MAYSRWNGQRQLFLEALESRWLLAACELAANASPGAPPWTEVPYAPLSPIGETDRQAVEFTWFETPGAVSYCFQVRDSVGAILHEQSLDSTRAQLDLSPADYQWRVIPVNSLDVPIPDAPWTPLTVTATSLTRENILGVEPDIDVPDYLQNFNYPEAAVRGEDGTIFISDTQSNVIRKIENGQSSIYAGTLRGEYNGDGFRTAVSFNKPTGLALDDEGDLVVLDAANYLLRKIDRQTGQVTTLVGQPGIAMFPEDGTPLASATLGWSTTLTKDPQGNLYLLLVEPSRTRIIFLNGDGLIHVDPLQVQRTNESVRDLSVTDEHIDLFVGKEFHRYYANGTVDKVALPAQFGRGIVPLPDGRTLIGNHTGLYLLDGDLNLIPISSGISYANIAWIEPVPDGYLIVDGDRGAILRLDTDFNFVPGSAIGSGFGEVGTDSLPRLARYDEETILILENKRGYIYSYSTVTGATEVFAGNGRLQAARFGVDKHETGFLYPAGIAVDSQKNVYVSENQRIIKISSDGTTSLFAGTTSGGYQGDGGPAINAQFRSIRDIQFDQDDNLYVADTYNHRIRKITTDGIVNTVAGDGVRGAVTFGAQATETHLNHPHGVLPLEDGRVLIANSWSNSIIQVNTDGTVTKLAGVQKTTVYQGNGDFGGDGGPALTAFLNTPSMMAMDDSGALIFSDTFNHRVRAVLPDGTIKTLWGSEQGYASDGSLFSWPAGIVIDGAHIYVADTGNGMIARLSLKTLQIELTTTDLSGSPITSAAVGELIQVVVSVKDLRANPEGVFAAYLDVEYDPTLVSLAGGLVESGDYANGLIGETSIPGIIDEAGAVASQSPLGANSHVLFVVPLRVEAPGVLVVTADAADDPALHASLLYGLNESVDVVEILYGEASIDIFVDEWTNVSNNLDVNLDGIVAPSDVLVILNDLNLNGPRVLPDRNAANQPRLDVNGDGSVTALDALMVINLLNQQSIAAEGEATRMPSPLVDEKSLPLASLGESRDERQASRSREFVFGEFALPDFDLWGAGPQQQSGSQESRRDGLRLPRQDSSLLTQLDDFEWLGQD